MNRIAGGTPFPPLTPGVQPGTHQLAQLILISIAGGLQQAFNEEAAQGGLRYDKVMVPRQYTSKDKQDYWQTHHLTTITLEEEFTLAEDIQLGLDSGADNHLNFGRFEGALGVLDATVEQAIA